MSEGKVDQKPKSFLESIKKDRNRPEEDAEIRPETKAKTPHTLGSEDEKREYKQGVQETALRQTLESRRPRSIARGEAVEAKKPKPDSGPEEKKYSDEGLLG